MPLFGVQAVEICDSITRIHEDPKQRHKRKVCQTTRNHVLIKFEKVTLLRIQNGVRFMDWKKLSEQQKTSERVAIGAIVVCIIVSVLGEVLVSKGVIFFRVLNLDSVSLAIIQIQATIQTLSIALLALTAGYSTSTFMGINFNRYLFEIKPHIFRQRIIVVALMVLLVLNILMHMMGFYNVVTGIFMAVCIMVCISTVQIYGIFVGNSKIISEIIAYTRFLASDPQKMDQRVPAFHTFCDGWKNCMENQDNREFDQYMEIYRLFQDSLLLAQQDNSRECVQSESASLIAGFCRSLNRTARERGLIFLFECYTEMCAIIRSHSDISTKGGVHILSGAYYDVLQLIRSLPVQSIEKHFQWYDFVDYVLISNLKFGYEKGNEFADLVDLSRVMGSYIANHKGENYDIWFWSQPLKNAEDMVRDPEHKRDVQELFGRVKYAYGIRLIQGGMLALLKDSFYNTALRNAWQIKSESGARLILELHCYIYYLAEYETTDCVSPVLKEECASFLRDSDVQKLFFYALKEIGVLDDKSVRRGADQGYLFRSDLIDRMYKELSRDELFQRYGTAKTMIMDAVVMDFVVFCGLFIHDCLYTSSILERLIPEEKAPSYYYRLVRNKDGEERFQRFLQLLGKENSEKKARELLHVLKVRLCEKTKRSYIKKAEQMQMHYEEDGNRSVEVENACNWIQAQLNQSFSEILYDGTTEEACVKIRVSSIRCNTEYSIQKNAEDCCSLWIQRLIEELCEVLNKLGAVRVRKKSDFADDTEMLSYFEHEDYGEIMGSWEVFSTKEYKNREQLNGILCNKRGILTDYTRSGLLIKTGGLRICIRRVRIGVHPALIQETKVEKQGDGYRLALENEIETSFTKEELEKFLHDYWKFYDVLFDVSIHRAEGIIGDLFLLNQEY